MEDRDVFILEEIIEYCNKINSTIDRHNGNRNDFDNDLDFQEACAFRVIQIGELVNNLSEKFKETHNEMPWRNIIAFRNIVTHDYGKIDIDKMWDTIITDIPALKNYCAKII
ncbi:DUF86 domain-containing protein [Candidatus Saccharibacteria bacterium]|nr:DUF86 domain-containing protein [Candidatus Saccharibacteria bacterium]